MKMRVNKVSSLKSNPSLKKRNRLWRWVSTSKNRNLTRNRLFNLDLKARVQSRRKRRLPRTHIWQVLSLKELIRRKVKLLTIREARRSFARRESIMTWWLMSSTSLIRNVLRSYHSGMNSSIKLKSQSCRLSSIVVQ